jgi:hypothetical protein
LWHVLWYWLGFGNRQRQDDDYADVTQTATPHFARHSTHYDWVVYMTALSYGITLWKAVQVERAAGRPLDFRQIFTQESSHYLFLATLLLSLPPQLTRMSHKLLLMFKLNFLYLFFFSL